MDLCPVTSEEGAVEGQPHQLPLSHKLKCSKYKNSQVYEVITPSTPEGLSYLRWLVAPGTATSSWTQEMLSLQAAAQHYYLICRRTLPPALDGFVGMQPGYTAPRTPVPPVPFVPASPQGAPFTPYTLNQMMMNVVNPGTPVAALMQQLPGTPVPQPVPTIPMMPTLTPGTASTAAAPGTPLMDRMFGAVQGPALPLGYAHLGNQMDADTGSLTDSQIRVVTAVEVLLAATPEDL